MTDVVTALIWRGEEFLICLRPPDKPNPLRWEFVGGKAEKSESLEAALIRECREELDVEIKVNDIFAETDHEYPKWITPDRIPEFNFCPADKDILEKITEKYGNK